MFRCPALVHGVEKLSMTLVKVGKADFVQAVPLPWAFVEGKRDWTQLQITIKRSENL